jgi:hypothetical protein
MARGMNGCTGRSEAVLVCSRMEAQAVLETQKRPTNSQVEPGSFRGQNGGVFDAAHPVSCRLRALLTTVSFLIAPEQAYAYSYYTQDYCA